MSARPEISVVVPFHDSTGHLAACIDALLDQDGDTAYEVILVDNRSSDGSASIARGYDAVRVLEEPRPGAYAARNTGIRAAVAPLIGLTDADCVVAPDWIDSIRRGMGDPDTAVLLGHVRYPSTASLPLRWLGDYEAAKARYVLQDAAPAHRFAYANNMAVRAAVFEEVGEFRDWPRAADTELDHRLAAARPDLRVAYRDGMRVVHAEFLRARDRLRRLSLYTRTNSRIATFRGLGFTQRLVVVGRALRGR